MNTRNRIDAVVWTLVLALGAFAAPPAALACGPILPDYGSALSSLLLVILGMPLFVGVALCVLVGRRHF